MPPATRLPPRRHRTLPEARILRYAGDGQEHSAREAVEKLADHFGLSEDERKELLPSGAQATFDNRVGWARTYMKKAELLESPRRGYFKITHRGMQMLKQNPDVINNKLLEQYPEASGNSEELTAWGRGRPRW